MILSWDILFSSMVTGLFVGIGSSVGAWVATRHITRRIEWIETKLKGKA